jgi:hypothetical protein
MTFWCERESDASTLKLMSQSRPHQLPVLLPAKPQNHLHIISVSLSLEMLISSKPTNSYYLNDNQIDSYKSNNVFYFGYKVLCLH